MSQSGTNTDVTAKPRSSVEGFGKMIMDDVIVALLYRTRLEEIDETKLGEACDWAAKQFGKGWSQFKRDSAGSNQCLLHAINNLMSRKFVVRAGHSHVLSITEHSRYQSGEELYESADSTLRSQINEVARYIVSPN